MSPLLSLIPLLVLVTIIPSIYGAYVRLSARLLGYMGVTWRQGFLFGFLVVVCSLLGRLIAFLVGYGMPIVSALLLGLFANLLIGGWLFSKRGVSTEGGPLGWGRAMKLTGVACAMLILTGAFVAVIPRMIMMRTLP